MFRTIGKSKIALLLAILFGISLFFMRGGSRYSNFFNSDNIIADISGTTISTSKFSRALTLNINQFNQMLGKQMSKEEIKNFQVATMALGALINDAIFENEYDTNNFKIDDSIIAKNTKERIPGLYDANNKLNKTYLNQFLQQENLQLEDIVQIINFETRDNYFNEAFFNISYPNTFSKQIYNYNKHFRLINYLNIPIDLIDLIESDLVDKNNLVKDYYNENINRYMTNEKRSIEFFSISKNDYLNDFMPSKNEISNYYFENLDLYKENEKRSFIQYNFKDLNEAKKFESEIQRFDNIKDIINFSNKNKIDFIEFDKLSKNEVLDEISSVLFGLQINEKSNIIKTTLANHIVVVKEVILEKQLELNEVKEIIKKTITDIEVNNYFNELIDSVTQYILDGNSIEEIKDEFNLDLKKLSNISKTYKNYDSDKEIFYKSLIENSFNSNKDFVNDIVKIDTDNYYIYNVTNILPSVAEDFSTIEKKVTEDWINVQKINKIEQVIQNNKTGLNIINQLSKKYNIEYQEIEISKNEQNLPKILTDEIFNKNKNDNLNVTDQNSVHIANIKDILIENKSDEEISSLSLMRDIKSSFGEELLKEVSIKTNDNLINAIIDRY